MRRISVQVIAPAILALLTGACASTGAVPRPFPMAGADAGKGSEGVSEGAASGPAEAPSASAADGYALTGTALALRGTPYRNGGGDPATGFDCSGFTQYVFSQHGLSLPREVRDQFHAGKQVQPDELTAGDLIFFTTVAPGPTHVGIVIGGDQFIHAPSSTGVVRIERLSSSYWSQRFLAARRVN
jgi:cell wall-associated NlpC family hydrolase